MCMCVALVYKPSYNWEILTFPLIHRFLFIFPFFYVLMTIYSNDIAKTVIETYQGLSSKGKPHVRSNGKKEWTILAGVVLVSEDGSCKCVSLGTGMKSTPNEQLDRADGKVLHDMHAEILAIRGFNRFLIEECKHVRSGMKSEYITVNNNTEKSSNHSYIFNPHVSIVMYVSEPPCGDASMTVLSKGLKDNWTEPLQIVNGEPNNNNGPVRGRDHVFKVGLVRTKPGRRDSPITYSKSCSDKLALRQGTSMLLGLVSERIIDPSNVYLSTLVIGNNCNYQDTHRAFTIRMKSAAGLQFGPYSCNFFDIVRTASNEPDFPDAKTEGAVPCPHSIVYVAQKNIGEEAILGGVKMGAKPFTGKGESSVCRNQIWKSVAALVDDDNNHSYIQAKYSLDRNLMKNRIYKELCGASGEWVPTKSDDFELII